MMAGINAARHGERQISSLAGPSSLPSDSSPPPTCRTAANSLKASPDSAETDTMGIFDKATATPSDADQQRLAQLCGIIDLGLKQFHKVGLALEEIRDRSLFKISHSTFAAFTQARWNMTEAHATRLIQAADLCRALGTDGHLIENENQARQLRQLSDEQREAVIADAIQGKPITASLKAHLPIGKKKIRPIKLSLPGCQIVITPNRKFPGLVATLENALKKAMEQQRDAA